jgi:hypothetical protein
MPDARTQEYVLELDVEADPIEGRVRDGEAAFDFTGWLGLASALERLISSAGGSNGNDPASEPLEGSMGGTG